MLMPWPVLFTPLIFLVVGTVLAGGTSRVHTVLRLQGHSHTKVSSWFGLKKEEHSFDVRFGQHLLEQANEISRYLQLPLERTGHGAEVSRRR